MHTVTLRLAAVLLVAALLSGTAACSNRAPDTTADTTADTTPAPAGGPARQGPWSTHRAGEIGPGGGRVFYVSRDPFPCGPDLDLLCNHLEVAPFADEASLPWSGERTDDRQPDRTADGTDIGTGARNTRTIVGRGLDDPATSAAAYADAYEHGGKTDWYLPSIDELHELTITREVVGGFTFGVYWSSTERGTDTAWYQHFMNSFQFPDDKTTLHQVRPVRAF